MNKGENDDMRTKLSEFSGGSILNAGILLVGGLWGFGNLKQDFEHVKLEVARFSGIERDVRDMRQSVDKISSMDKQISIHEIRLEDLERWKRELEELERLKRKENAR